MKSKVTKALLRDNKVSSVNFLDLSNIGKITSISVNKITKESIINIQLLVNKHHKSQKRK